MRSAAFFQQITNPPEIPVNYTVRKPQHRQLILLQNLRPHAVILPPSTAWRRFPFPRGKAYPRPLHQFPIQNVQKRIQDDFPLKYNKASSTHNVLNALLLS